MGVDDGDFYLLSNDNNNNNNKINIVKLRLPFSLNFKRTELIGELHVIVYVTVVTPWLQILYRLKLSLHRQRLSFFQNGNFYKKNDVTKKCLSAVCINAIAG